MQLSAEPSGRIPRRHRTRCVRARNPVMTGPRLPHDRIGDLEPVAQVGYRCFFVQFGSSDSTVSLVSIIIARKYSEVFEQIGFFPKPFRYWTDCDERRLLAKAACRTVSADYVEKSFDRVRADIRANRSGLPGGSESAALGGCGPGVSSRRSHCPAGSDLRSIRRTSTYASCLRPA